MMREGCLLAILALTVTSCRQDMQDQPKYKPLALSHFFADGRTARPVPAGTIAIDETNNDPAMTTGVTAAGFLTTIPLPITTELLERGQERFDIACSPCHGRIGDG